MSTEGGKPGKKKKKIIANTVALKIGVQGGTQESRHFFLLAEKELNYLLV